MEKFDNIYPFTTENIAGYMNGMDLTGKKVVTVVGSGDHVINSILNGAEEIQAFDINPLTKYYLDLKLAAIKKLSFDKFLKVFLYNSKIAFDRRIISKLPMDLESMEFFLRRLDEYSDGLEFKRSELFHITYFNTDSTIWNNLYLNRRNYNLVKKRIGKVRIKYSNVSLKDLVLDKDYDYMFLSNIADYINMMYDEEALKKYSELIYKFLEQIKQIYFAYLYDIGSKSNRSEINNLDKVKEVFPDMRIETFRSVYDNGFNNKRDGVLILRRK